MFPFLRKQHNMVPIQVVLIAALFAGVFYVGDEAVKGIKKVDRIVAHDTKVAGQKTWHGLKHLVGK
jgi:hypothetical protein